MENYRSNNGEGIWSSNHQTSYHLLKFKPLLKELLKSGAIFVAPFPALIPRHRKIIKEQELKEYNGIF